MDRPPEQGRHGPQSCSLGALTKQETLAEGCELLTPEFYRKSLRPGLKQTHAPTSPASDVGATGVKTESCPKRILEFLRLKENAYEKLFLGCFLSGKKPANPLKSKVPKGYLLTCLTSSTVISGS